VKVDEQNRHTGKPGKPGERGTAQRGGTGGVGGEGGEGGTTGGEGGAGGTGGQMGPMGPTGDQGRRGPTSRWGLIGYAILTGFMVFALFRVESLRDERRQQTTLADIRICEFQNENRRAVRKVSTILLTSLEAAARRMGDDPAIQRVFREQIVVLEEQLKNLQPENCANLPSR
jgi:hypothetical protein